MIYNCSDFVDSHQKKKYYFSKSYPSFLSNQCSDGLPRTYARALHFALQMAVLDGRGLCERNVAKPAVLMFCLVCRFHAAYEALRNIFLENILFERLSPHKGSD